MLDHDTMPEGLGAWLDSGKTGASSKCIAAHLAGQGEVTGDYPRDAGDFGRCEGLLKAVPDLQAELPRMAEVNAYWAALVPRWDDIRQSKRRTALIKKIIEPVQEADPGHVELREGLSVRVGGITFKGDDAFEQGIDALKTKLDKELGAGRAPMKETDADREVRDGAYRATAGELRQFIERFERLDAEKKDLSDLQKELMAEAKARGYDTKALRRLIAIRKRDADDVAEEEAVLALYKEVLGMS